MPEVPTYRGQPSLMGTGGPRAKADAFDFGAGVAQATQGLGNQLSQSANVVAGIAEQRKVLENDRWVSEAITRARNHISPWMADPVNNSKETYAEDLMGMATKLGEEYSGAAPSKMARQQFQAQYGNLISSRFESATITSARTRTTNLITSQENENNSVVEAYRMDRSIPDYDANTGLVKDIMGRQAQIDASLGKIAPQEAKALKNQLVEDSVYAAMDHSPSLARKILDMGDLDGRRRHAIENQIEAAENSVKALDSVLLAKMMDDRVAQAKEGKRPTKFTIADLLPFTSRDKAEALVFKGNADIETYNMAHDFTDKVSSWSGPEQLKALDELSQKVGTDPANADRDSTIRRIVTEQITANVRAMNRDAAGYLMQNNPSVRAANERIRNLPENSMSRGQFQAERDALMLKFQSQSPPGTPAEEARQYSVVNRSQLKVISNGEAAAAVQRINESSPGEALNTILSVLQQHPGNEATAFQNMVTLQEGPGLRGDYWLVYKNWKNPEVKDLIGALQAGKEFRETTPEKLVDFETALEAYGPWLGFLRTMPADNFQREGMVAGFRSGIVTHALATAQTQNIAPELAIKKSVDKWVYTEMSLGSVNGQSVLFDRDRDNKAPMTDAEVKVLSDNLALAPRFLDVTKLKLDDDWGREHFLTLRLIGNESTRLDVIRGIIRDRGYYQPDSTGRMATLYIRGDDGRGFEARDKDNKAFMVDTHSVPTLTRSISTFMNPSGIKVEPGSVDYTKPVIKHTGYKYEYPERVWGIFQGSPNIISQYQTNWPVEPRWMRRIER